MRRFTLHTLIACLLAAVPLLAPTPAFASGKVGIVLLHGKTGTPNQLARLAAALQAAGFAVETPEMCWSKTRIFDQALPECLSEVDTATAKLKSEGDNAIVVGGTSQGAVAALAYGAAHADLAGIIAMAPAADPNDAAAFPKFAKSIATAQALVQSGKGDAATIFSDLISGGDFVTVHATPKAFLSFHGPDSPVSTIRNLTATTMPNLHMPVLWVAGTSDPSQKGAPKSFAALPHNAKSRYATVAADHAGTPDASADVVIAWLKTLP
jgi:alpha-beta hydrolase superfamily lysophospholipase